MIPTESPTAGPSRSPSVADQDCSTCRRRRIKCDRGLPSCGKCGSRSLQCPGYGTKLKWVQVMPCADKGPNSCELAQGTSQELSSSMFNHDQTNLLHISGLHQGQVVMANQSNETAVILVQQPDYSSGISSNAWTRQLLHHYNHVIAAQMVWVDSAQNPFREIILPLAVQSPTLMMSVLSVSAGDLWARSGQRFDCTFSSSYLLDHYHGETLTHLVDHLRDETDHSQSSNIAPRNRDHASPILAAFLLGSLSLKLKDFSAWRLHTRAAWSMIEHWNICPSSALLSLESVRGFLLHEVYASKVWESVTTFQPLEDICGATLSMDLEGPFIQYLGVILRLAETERTIRHKSSDNATILSFSDLEMALEQARCRTYTYADTLVFHSAKARNAFEYVVDMFHHAGLLYGSHVLPEDDYSRGVCRTSRLALFEALHTIIGAEMIAQDLTWPIFIAGTECYNNTQMQRVVNEKMREIMRVSGDLERPKLLHFLDEFWYLRNLDPNLSWIDLARTYAQRDNPILII